MDRIYNFQSRFTCFIHLILLFLADSIRHRQIYNIHNDPFELLNIYLSIEAWTIRANIHNTY